MNVLNHVLTSAGDVLLAPLAGSPRLALLAVSVVAGVLMTVTFRHTTNQAALRRISQRIGAMLLCLRLFKDDIGIYEARNNGRWYNFGFIFGLMIVFGGNKGAQMKFDDWEDEC